MVLVMMEPIRVKTEDELLDAAKAKVAEINRAFDEAYAKVEDPTIPFEAFPHGRITKLKAELDVIMGDVFGLCEVGGNDTIAFTHLKRVDDIDAIIESAVKASHRT